MKSKDNSTNPPYSSTITERLKAKREMLGIIPKNIAKHLDISVKEVECYEGQKSCDNTATIQQKTENPQNIS